MSYVQGYFGTGASAGSYGVSQGGDEADADGVILHQEDYDVALGDFAGLTGLPTDVSTAAKWEAFADALAAKPDEMSSQPVYATVYCLNLVGVGSDQDDTFTSYATVSARLHGGGGNDQLIDGNNTTAYLDGGNGDDTLTGGAGADTLVGGAGVDFVSYAGFGSAVNVNLVTGLASGGGGGDSLSSIEKVTGTDFDDVLTGGAGSETLQGGAGADTLTGGGRDDLFGGDGSDVLSGYGNLDGGAGDDLITMTGIGQEAVGGFFDGAGAYNILRLDFSVLDEAVTVSLHGLAGAPVGGNISDASEDGVAAFFQVLGDSKLSRFADSVVLNNVFASDAPTIGLIQALGGDDTVTGGGFDEHVSGGAGRDLLSGLGGADSLLGGAGADTIEGGDGDDSLNGGSGFDTVTYASASSGVTVFLHGPGPRDTGGAGVDTVRNFEAAIGSAFDDVLHGNGEDNALSGGTGRDRLFGGGGADTLTAIGDGDFMSGGQGDDLYVLEYGGIRHLGDLGSLDRGDTIDVSAVAAAVGAGRGYNHFTEVAVFDGQAGEMIAHYVLPEFGHTDRTRFLFDVDGDGKADLKLVVVHGDHVLFTNFIGVDTSGLVT